MTNPNEAALKLNKANAALLKTGLLSWRANLYFVFITLIWMSVLAAHIYLRFPWGNKDITSSKGCCAYLFFPALLAVILGMVRAFTDPVTSKSKILNAKIAEVSRSSNAGLQNVTDSAKVLFVDSCIPSVALLVVLFILSIACIAVAKCLDIATDSSKIRGLAIAECTLLAAIITTLIAFTFGFCLMSGTSRMGHMTEAEMNCILQKVEATQVNPNPAQNIGQI